MPASDDHAALIALELHHCIEQEDTMRNVGPIDRALRFVLGVALLTLAFTGPRTLWGALGLIPLVTAMLGWCPLYTLLGISTRPRTPGTP